MEKLIRKYLSGKRVLMLFILTSIIYAMMLLVTIPRLTHFSVGMKILDMMPLGYSAEYVNALLNALGESGRNAYLYDQLPLDMIYPFMYGLTYCLVLAWFLESMGKLKGFFVYLCLLPLAAATFDYLENIGIITMLKSYPHNSDLLSQTTNVFSVLKSSLTTVYFLVLIVVVILFGIKRLSRNTK
ncbi:MAG TPA: hypothetical protein VF298_03190 [Bacteroidales bacterium]|jgi:hypothetical protein